jgi:DNA-binding response OmpR family regulator
VYGFQRVETHARIEPASPRSRQLGQILLEHGVISEASLNHALLEQRRVLLPLGSMLIHLGLAEARSVTQALSQQKGVPGVDLSKCVLDLDVVVMVPRTVAEAHLILPLADSGHGLQIAMADPGRRDIIDEIALGTGRVVLPHVAIRAELMNTVRAVWAARDGGEARWAGSEQSRGVTELHVETVAAFAPALAPAGVVSVPAVQDEFPSSWDTLTDSVEEVPVLRSGRTKVLVVDDEPEILELVQTALSHRNFDVVCASRGRQALECLKAEIPDVVLLDAMLPEIHGFEICRFIKGSAQFKHIPVIIISAIYTGWNFAQDLKRTYGADDHIPKPFSVVELVRRVDDVVAKAKGHPAAAAAGSVKSRSVKALRGAMEAVQAARWSDAVELARQAVGIDPFDDRSYFVLGTALQRLGRTYEAITAYERVVQLKPSNFSALKNLAVLYERQGFRAKALEIWLRALDESPSDPVRQTIKAHLIGLL